MSADRPALRALGERLGIVPEYTDVDGARHVTSDENRAALLAAMGHDVATEAAAAAALADSMRAERERFVAPAVVLEWHERHEPRIEVRPGGPDGETRRWEVEVALEEGGTVCGAGESTLEGGSLAIRLPALERLGYHRAHIRVAGGGEGATTVILAPLDCWTATEALGDRGVFGLWSNLYTLRSAHDWGIGDAGDLRRLAEWAGGQGAEFVGVNPLHALWNRGADVSPYSPVSRLFRNPAYIEVPGVPEYDAGDAPPEAVAALRAEPLVDYEGVMRAKLAVLETLHRRFVEHHRDGATARGRAYAEWCASQGDALRDFATFMVLDETQRPDGQPVWWREWPADYRAPDAPGIAAFRRAHAERIDFHCWLQFELDRQLGAAAEAARGAGMGIGLYQDLAVGTSGGGSDAWAFGDLLCPGATIGAPPDPYAREGQDWGFPPIDPHRLAAGGWDYWIRLVRGAMRHAGALRIDHAMGLGRLYWIPAGRSAREGAYVRYPARELFAILALESRRHRALVVGEDLGTVPEGFEALLERWGVLSSRVLYFERTLDGAFRPASQYSRRALVTVSTHDHVPLAGFWEGSDIAIRAGLGLVALEDVPAAAESREADRQQLLDRFRADDLLPQEGRPAYPELCAAAHAFLARTPSPLLGVALDDLAAETVPVNIPGVGPDRYPVWRRKMRLPLEALRDDPGVARGLDGAGERAHRPHPA